MNSCPCTGKSQRWVSLSRADKVGEKVRGVMAPWAAVTRYQTGVFNNSYYFPTVLEAGKLMSQCLVKAGLLACRWAPIHCGEAFPPGGWRDISLVLPFFYKDISPVRLWPHLYDFIYPQLLPQKCHLQIQPCWGSSH